MSTNCQILQEKLACEISLELVDQQHLVTCSYCQKVYSDYQLLVSLIEEEENVALPDAFAEKVMKAIEQPQNAHDWYEDFLILFQQFMDAPLIQYSTIATGFGLGIITFCRFVAFVFIPA